MDWFSDIFSAAQQWLFEAAVQPAMFALGMGNLLEDGYDATAWFMVGVIQVLILLAIIGPLQRWRPVEPVTDRATIRTDVLYTLIHRLGLFRIALFFTLDPWFDEAFGALRTAGYGTFHLDQLWPGVTDHAVVSLLIYLVVFDFVAYWTHRGQHQIEWWWRLHSLHHAQRQMTMWSDNRNHLLDDILVDSIVVLVAQLIGVPPGQFVAIVAFTQLSESFQHANVRLWFGRIGERLWVSPRFHRLHHSIGIGHETVKAERTVLGGHNFGVLLPWWDVLFGTANFEQRYDPTGIRDQVEANRDYGRGFWSQQWIGLKRLFGRA
ncbi:Sterol desaturase/sphingolipid hydroxylase, fatty acid hydroxylase superfamily [Polaromonas sp. YR568]|uniref:sterol desaturase family protein n=1 Tax=Polaromonas sp. YR568 TaxID=1855301 RepID=UPI0008E19931|nr:sterol desaturase family protein [Polaromonas sp. YR568]SFU87858.1 Sterol desaturase/sphingolipid hydroxylase, fatty acid hydroxylase superfamily [Polaromonas sp. YR568]